MALSCDDNGEHSSYTATSKLTRQELRLAHTWDRISNVMLKKETVIALPFCINSRDEERKKIRKKKDEIVV
jgi:hypothetical protein